MADPPLVSESTSTRFSSCLRLNGGVWSCDLECDLQGMGISLIVATSFATTGDCGSNRDHCSSVDCAHYWSLGYSVLCKLWCFCDMLVFLLAGSGEVGSGSWPAKEQFVANLYPEGNPSVIVVIVVSEFQ